MQIEDNDNIVSAQIINLKKSKILLKTEKGKYLTINYPKKQHNSKLFTKILKDIWRHHLWIPVNKETQQLLQYDWLQ